MVWPPARPGSGSCRPSAHLELFAEMLCAGIKVTTRGRFTRWAASEWEFMCERECECGSGSDGLSE